MPIVSIFLVMVALIAGMVGCVGAMYDLTISSTEGGEVATPGEGTFTYDGGKVVNLVATPANGYRFVNWAGDIDTIASPDSATTTITMDEARSVTANFALLGYNLAVHSAGGGSVITPGEGTFAYDEGTVVNLLAEAEDGYHFVNWTGNVGTIANVNTASTTITMNDDYSIMANFEEFEKGGAVYFADPNLEAAVREAIAIPEGPIYPSDLEGLTSLSASQKNIADLTGLEYATSLTSLLIHSNQLSDLSPLVNLTSLEELGLVDNQISDISPLANLTSLTWLNLGHNQISDISPLANLTSLTNLWICYNQVSDISPLVENEGFSTGDYVCMKENPLSPDSRNIYIPQLKARGVRVVSQ
jgi:hypothetical protein